MIFTEKEISCLKAESRFEIYDKFQLRLTENKKSIKIKIFGRCVPLKKIAHCGVASVVS